MTHEGTRTDLAQVPIGAHRHRDFIARARLGLAWMALGGVVLFGVVDFGSRGESRYTPGPLAVAHATWDNRCEVCHVDARPVGGNNWLASLTDAGHKADVRCQSCHAGPPHHGNQRAGAEAACTSCHLEHRGRQASLTRVGDDQCLRCHGDLARHGEPGKPANFLDVPSFEEHPEFRLVHAKSIDPGHVAFDHGVHMKKGLRHDADSPYPFTLAQVEADRRERYRRPGQTTNSAPVQLECASCHRTDDPGLRREQLPEVAGMPSRSAGRTMRPIVYETHCQACHPLSFEGKVKDDARPGLVAVRHRLQLGEIRDVLEGHFARQFLLRDPAPPKRPSRPLPAKNPLTEEDKSKVTERVRASVARAEKILFGANTCGQCHRGVLETPPRIEPAAIPRVWFTHARFDHTSHRTVDCRDCHARADAANVDGSPNVHVSRTNADILLPGIDVCRKCHGPATASAGTFRGGARFDCAECHRYHDHGRREPRTQ